MAELLAPALVRLVGRVPVLVAQMLQVGPGVAIGGDIAIGTTEDTTDNRVDHGYVANDDGDKGFSTGPTASLLGTVGTGLICQYTRMVCSVR